MTWITEGRYVACWDPDCDFQAWIGYLINPALSLRENEGLWASREVALFAEHEADFHAQRILSEAGA